MLSAIIQFYNLRPGPGLPSLWPLIVPEPELRMRGEGGTERAPGDNGYISLNKSKNENGVYQTF